MVSFLRVSLPKLSMHPSSSPHVPHVPPFSFSLVWYTNNIWWAVQIMTLLALPSTPVFCYFRALRPQYLAQHPTLERSQRVFLPYRDKPIFTPMKNGSQDYNSLYFGFQVLKEQPRRRTIGISFGSIFTETLQKTAGRTCVCVRLINRAVY